MSGPELLALLGEASDRRIGPLWLSEVRDACRRTVRRFDPTVYAVAERSWTRGEIDELVQDVVLEQLLRQGQLQYILDIAESIGDVRRLLRQQVHRALVRRRRRTVVDQLLTRIRELLRPPAFEIVGPGPRHRPFGSGFGLDPVPDSVIRKAAGAIRMLPKTASSGDRSPMVYRSDVLKAVIGLSFEAAQTSLSIDDFGRILRDALTSWVPVVLEQSDESETSSAESTDLSFELEETVAEVLAALDETDRVALRLKLAGEPDSQLAARLGVSRPTAANIKKRAFERLRVAWVAHAGELAGDESIRLVEELYARLSLAGGPDV
jgi:RNA polymerase sigma factor (sigma-70 family)